MPFELIPDSRPQFRRTTVIAVLASLLMHLLFFLLLTQNPDWLDYAKRVVWLKGEEYDPKRDATMLTLPAAIPPVESSPVGEPESVAPTPPPELEPSPEPLPTAPLQPPAPLPLPLPPPSPPPPPPPPLLPPAVIMPNDLIADGARPDATPQPSRGNTPDPARIAGGIPGPALPQPIEPPRPAPPPPSEPPVAPAPNNTETPARASTPGSGSDRGLLPPLIAQNSNPNALRLPSLGGGRVSGVVDNAIQNAVNNQLPRSTTGTGASRTGNDRGLEQLNFNTDEPKILSDTKGYDFGPYLNQIVNRVRVNWYSLIPESVRYNGQRGRVVLTFTIVKSGAVEDLTLKLTSSSEPLDRAAMGSITASHPFQQLPAQFRGDHLTLQFTFLYNILP